ncbi:MAG: maleylacetoacetate isomerase [Myxococcaceae bacterium]
MKLYQGWRSSASWRVRWALKLKGVEFEPVWVDIENGENLKVVGPKNPLASLPTLELDDGTTITDSVAIIEWLEETRPEPRLLPKDPLERARVRQLVQLISSGTHPMQNSSVKNAAASDPEGQRAWCAKWIVRGLTAYEAHLAQRPSKFSHGDTLTMADLYLVPQVKNGERHGADLSRVPNVMRVYQTCLATPEAQATLPLATPPR